MRKYKLALIMLTSIIIPCGCVYSLLLSPKGIDIKNYKLDNEICMYTFPRLGNYPNLHLLTMRCTDGLELHGNEIYTLIQGASDLIIDATLLPYCNYVKSIIKSESSVILETKPDLLCRLERITRNWEYKNVNYKIDFNGEISVISEN